MACAKRWCATLKSLTARAVCFSLEVDLRQELANESLDPVLDGRWNLSGIELCQRLLCLVLCYCGLSTS